MFTSTKIRKIKKILLELKVEFKESFMLICIQYVVEFASEHFITSAMETLITYMIKSYMFLIPYVLKAVKSCKELIPNVYVSPVKKTL